MCDRQFFVFYNNLTLRVYREPGSKTVIPMRVLCNDENLKWKIIRFFYHLRKGTEFAFQHTWINETLTEILDHDM